ncbi:MAG: CotH kinase family protein [Saprospiraceae bacterium]|nr:CotH kinase family protein [Saprospiraceae bacterium]
MRKRLLYLFIFGWNVLSGQDFTSSNLPILVVDTQGEVIPDEPKIDVLLGVIYNGPGNINYLDDPFNEYDGWAGIERRGSTSQDIFPKTGYSLETREEDGENNNVSLLGLPDENDWVLHGPYSDKTLIRNVLAYELAGRIMDWAPRTRFCELVINGEYQGLFVLLEKIKRDNDRVDIAKLKEADISGDQLTGGYIIKLDKTTGATADGWQSLYKPIPGQDQVISFLYHEPEPDEIQPAQKYYIQYFMDAFEGNLLSDDFDDPVDGYSKYIDPASFVDFLIINEVSRNVDGYRLSTFFYKDRDSTDSRLKMGPVWDFNIAFGNAYYCGGESTEGFAFNFNEVCSGDFWLIPFWWDRLLEDSAFACSINNRWTDLRQDLFSTSSILEMVDSLVNTVGEAADRNFEKWPILGEEVWPNYFVGSTYQEEIDFLKSWLEQRLDFLDSGFESLCNATTLSPIPGAVPVRVAPNLTGGETVGFHFTLSRAAEIRFRIFDVSGKLIVDETTSFPDSGQKSLYWEPLVPAGTYLYQLDRNGEPLHAGKVVRY